MRYLPLTDADRRNMLASIGVSSVESLFQDVPESVLLADSINLLITRANWRLNVRSLQWRRRTHAREACRFSLGLAAIVTMCLQRSIT